MLFDVAFDLRTIFYIAFLSTYCSVVALLMIYSVVKFKVL